MKIFRKNSFSIIVQLMFRFVQLFSISSGFAIPDKGSKNSILSFTRLISGIHRRKFIGGGISPPKNVNFVNRKNVKMKKEGKTN